jgi:hypothetical protein
VRQRADKALRVAAEKRRENGGPKYAMKEWIRKESLQEKFDESLYIDKSNQYNYYKEINTDS